MRRDTKRNRAVAAALLALAVAAVLAFGTSSTATVGSPAASAHEGHNNAVTSRKAFRDDMRRLWVDHVAWTRLFIVSFVGELPDLEATTARLLKNQVDIGDAVQPFYGREGADHLTVLLNEHILVAADVLAAAKSGHTAAFDRALDAWYDNGNEIATFLHDANPRNWPLAEMRQMMKVHLDLTLREAADQLGGNYASSVAIYDDVETEILHMADMLASGLIKQFPNEFA